MAVEALDQVDDKTVHSKVRKLAKSHARTRVTNGKSLLGPGVDGRSLWARRFRDVLALHLSDLGGEGVTFPKPRRQSLGERLASLSN
jgi:hypothetical protein